MAVDMLSGKTAEQSCGSGSESKRSTKPPGYILQIHIPTYKWPCCPPLKTTEEHELVTFGHQLQSMQPFTRHTKRLYFKETGDML